jgi:tRNA A37 methylthiotransferase MiaB
MTLSDSSPLQAPGFSTVYKRPKAGVTFTQLVDRISQVDPEIRIRFTSPHPKDFPVELLELIRDRPNVCKQLHMPAQSGSTTVLEYVRPHNE